MWHCNLYTDVLCSVFETGDFCVLILSIRRGWATCNCIKCNIIHIPVFVSLHSFFLYLGIRTFAVDLFIVPSKEKITVLTTDNTEHKRENSKRETRKSKYRSHKLWTQNSKHLHTKHNMYNGNLYATLCFVYRCFVFCVHSLWLLCVDFWVLCCEFFLSSFVLFVFGTVVFLLEDSIKRSTAN